MKLHDITTHIYKKTIKLLGLQVLGDDGWNDIISVNVTQKSKLVKIVADDGKMLTCSLKHILIKDDGEEVLAKDSLHCNIKNIDGKVSKVISVIELEDEEELYDLSLAKDTNHLYYTNGLLSHNCVIIDEVAFIPKNVIDEFFASVMPVVSSAKNSKAILVSTPNGTSGLYYDLWQQANSPERAKNKEGWSPFRVDWFEVPGRTPEWKEKQIASIGIERWNQEFGNEFLSGSSTHKLIPDDVLEQFRMKLSEYKALGVLPKKQRIVSQDEKEIFEFDMWHEF